MSVKRNSELQQRVVMIKHAFPGVATSAIALALLTSPLLTSPLSAQVVHLKCEMSEVPQGSGVGYLAIVDYGKKTLTVRNLDSAGNINNLGFDNMPATVSSDSIDAGMQMRCGFIRWILNRRSGILISSHNTQSCGGTELTRACVPYIARPQKF
jgi:hypothetical protein